MAKNSDKPVPETPKKMGRPRLPDDQLKRPRREPKRRGKRGKRRTATDARLAALLVSAAYRSLQEALPILPAGSHAETWAVNALKALNGVVPEVPISKESAIEHMQPPLGAKTIADLKAWVKADIEAKEAALGALESVERLLVR